MSLFQPPKVRADIIPGAVLTQDEENAFERQIFADWSRGQEYTATKAQLIAVSEHLDYLRWLRDASLPDLPSTS